MAISMYQASVPGLIHTPTGVSAILEKAAEHATQHKIEPALLLNTRLFPDMFPLVRQVRLACDFDQGADARLAGIEIPKLADTEASIEELKARIAKTVNFLKTLKPAAIGGSEARDIEIPVASPSLHFKGQAYLLFFVLPNIYLHAATTSDILWRCRRQIGKRGFIGSFEFG